MDNPRSKIKRIVMSDEDELFYIIKHGHEPTFRIETNTNLDWTGDPSIDYIVTNIDKATVEEDDDDTDGET